MLDHAEVVRLYGPWKVRTPSDAAEFLRHYSGRWWIAGGWAIDAFAGTARARRPRHRYPPHGGKVHLDSWQITTGRQAASHM